MTRSQRINQVGRIAENREKEAAKEMLEAQTKVEGQQARLNELIHYRNEYSNRLRDQSGRSIDVRQLTDLHAFIARLDLAIEQQRGIVEAAKGEYAAQHRAWIEKRTRTKALDKATENLRMEEQKDRDRREQKELDERNSARSSSDE